MRMMNRSFPRKTMVAASLVVLTLAALSGSPSVSTVSAFMLIAGGIIVAAALLFLSRRGLPPTVAELLQSVELPPATKTAADIGDHSADARGIARRRAS